MRPGTKGKLVRAHNLMRSGTSLMSALKKTNLTWNTWNKYKDSFSEEPEMTYETSVNTASDEERPDRFFLTYTIMSTDGLSIEKKTNILREIWQ